MMISYLSEYEWEQWKLISSKNAVIELMLYFKFAKNTIYSILEVQYGEMN